MKRLTFYFLIIIIAVAFSPNLIGETGYVLISIGNMIIESTVTTMIILLLLLLLAVTFIFKVYQGGLRLSKGTWQLISFASKRKAERQFKQGVSAYLLADYQVAEQLLVKSATKISMPSVAYSLAADAAQKQNLSANTEYYLTCLGEQAKAETSSDIEQALVTIKLQMQLQNYAKARSKIDEYHKHIGHDSRLLSLEIELSLIEKRCDNAIDYLLQANKDQSINESLVSTWQQQAYQQKFIQLITKEDQASLFLYWQKLAKKIKQKPAVILAYCQVLAQYQLIDKLDEQLLPMITANADDILVKQIRLLPLTKTESLIAAVQKHLLKNPKSSQWLSCLGFLAYAGKNFDMAEKAYASLIHHENSYDQDDIVLFAKVLIAKNDHLNASKLLLNNAVNKH